MIGPVIADISSWQGDVDLAAFVEAGAPFAGLVLKASQGRLADPRFAERRKAFRAAAGARLGQTLIDGAYHFLDLTRDGAQQADFFLQTLEQIGGPHGLLVVDVERDKSFPFPSRSVVEDCAGAFSWRVLQATGRAPILYGGELLRAVGARSLFGCSGLWISHYAALLDLGRGTADLVLTTAGCPLEQLLLWQYIGGGDTPAPAGYPTTAPGLGRVDLSAVVVPGGLDALRSLAAG